MAHDITQVVLAIHVCVGYVSHLTYHALKISNKEIAGPDNIIPGTIPRVFCHDGYSHHPTHRASVHQVHQASRVETLLCDDVGIQSYEAGGLFKKSDNKAGMCVSKVTNVFTLGFGIFFSSPFSIILEKEDGVFQAF